MLFIFLPDRSNDCVSHRIHYHARPTSRNKFHSVGIALTCCRSRACLGNRPYSSSPPDSRFSMQSRDPLPCLQDILCLLPVPESLLDLVISVGGEHVPLACPAPFLSSLLCPVLFFLVIHSGKCLILDSTDYNSRPNTFLHTCNRPHQRLPRRPRIRCRRQPQIHTLEHTELYLNNGM